MLQSGEPDRRDRYGMVMDICGCLHVSHGSGGRKHHDPVPAADEEHLPPASIYQKPSDEHESDGGQYVVWNGAVSGRAE